ncbi:cilia- and flagella-associated protein 157 isoform X8 [Tachysurus fulvidraco]|uniref:cilia- and flagella-associated protein 157 isoform X8 n=1 Tax=Tachysurus fulvidraco TaxID=1234273 RepID=UPI000F505950|nr:cilia- and flagella-associated protein 157 isoform X8 [Tachysurus fulvidraco]
MPPKKDGKQNTDKKNTLGEKTIPDEALSEGGKEFYLAQIRDLEDRLEKYQHKCDELEVRQKDFSTNYDNIVREKKDIVLYLKRTLSQKEDKLTDVLEKLQDLQAVKDAEKESYDKQLSMLRSEFQETKDKLTSENMVLAGKLASLEDFQVQKDELMFQLESLKEQLVQQKQEHQTVLYNLEKKAVLDNYRLKKEMQQHVAAVATEFRKVSDKKMPETTKRAIHENILVTTQLRQISDRSKELMVENDALMAREKQLKREIEIMEPLLNEMTRKSLSNQKVVQQLTVKCRQMSAELEEYARHKQEHQKLLNNHSILQKEHDVLRQEHESAVNDLNQKQAEAARLKTELQAEKTRRGQVETVLQEAAAALKEVPKEEDTEVQTLAQRNQMMQKLLAVLDSAAAISKGTTLTHFIPVTEDSNEFKTAAGMERSGVAAPKVTPSRFKPGELGLMERQTHTGNSVISKRQLLSKNLQRKPKKGMVPQMLKLEKDTLPMQPGSVRESQAKF